MFQVDFLLNRTNFCKEDKLLPDLCQGFFWSEENVYQCYYNQNGVWENVCLVILDTHFPYCLIADVKP